MMDITIGTCPCSFGVWYKDGGPTGITSKQFLDGASLCKFPVLELGPVGYLAENKEQLTELMKQYPMNVVSGTVCISFFKENRWEDYRELCTMIKSQGGEYLIFMDESDVGSRGERKQLWSTSDWEQLFSSMQSFTEFVQQQGLTPLLHPHVGSAIETEYEIETFWKYLDVDLCLDTGHHAFSNGSLGEKETSVINFIGKYSNKIPYLHFKNIDLTVLNTFYSSHWSFEEAFENNVMCDIEDGWINFLDIKHILEQINFKGYAILEQDMPKANYEQTLQTAQKNFTYLANLFGLLHP